MLFGALGILCFGQVNVIPPNIVVSHTIYWWQNFQLASTPTFTASHSSDSLTVKWVNPRLGFLKFNVDGAWNANCLICGVGVLLRDVAGNFVAGLAKYFPHVPSPFFVEALAVREGLALASSRCLHNIVIESHSL
ncbi:hypothetical protein ACFX2H_019082 [Malus domestica]